RARARHRRPRLQRRPTSLAPAQYAVSDPPPRHEGHGLGDDGSRHLRRASHTVDELDRYLDNPTADLGPAVGHFDLASVTTGPARNRAGMRCRGTTWRAG